jgi:hypothetical protein
MCHTRLASKGENEKNAPERIFMEASSLHVREAFSYEAIRHKQST